MEVPDFCLILNTGDGLFWIRVMHCHVAGNLPFIPIAMSDSIYPGLRASRVVMVM